MTDELLPGTSESKIQIDPMKRNEILNHPEVASLEQKAQALLKKEMFDPESLKRVSKEIFPRIRTHFSQLIGKRVAEPLRSKLQDRISKIQFSGSYCTPDQKHPFPAALLADAHYSAETNDFDFCWGLLTTGNSEFRISQVIAHELAHSVDPCGITFPFRGNSFHYSDPKDIEKSQSEFPFKGVISCLRSPKSVQALRFENKPEIQPKTKTSASTDPRLSAISGSSTSTNQGGNSPFYKGEQINESFADWAADEIVPKVISELHAKLTRNQFRAGYSNIFRGQACTPASPTSTQFRTHPSREMRVNRLLLVQPKIRKQMGCKGEQKSAVHCPLKLNQ